MEPQLYYARAHITTSPAIFVNKPFKITLVVIENVVGIGNNVVRPGAH